MSAQGTRSLMEDLTRDLQSLLLRYQLAPCLVTLLLSDSTKAIMLNAAPEDDGMTWSAETGLLTDLLRSDDQ